MSFAWRRRSWRGNVAILVPRIELGNYWSKAQEDQLVRMALIAGKPEILSDSNHGNTKVPQDKTMSQGDTIEDDQGPWHWEGR